MAKSMALNAAAGLGGMLKDGHKTFEGVHGAVLKNIEAAKGLAGMVNTSLGMQSTHVPQRLIRACWLTCADILSRGCD